MATYLIVDDSPTIRLTFRRILEALDADDPQVVEAENPSQAIDEFEHSPADLTFLDIQLGPAAGNEVLRELLRRKPEARIVIATSAPRDDERVQDALGQGAFAFLPKPLRRDEVAKVLAELEHESKPTRRIH